jgi:hypothetical protein
MGQLTRIAVAEVKRSVAAMPNYRAYILAPDGRIMRPVDLECPDDEAAKEAAKQLVNIHDVELWHGARKIETFKHKPA